MKHPAVLGSVFLIFLACAALPACGQQDEAQAVLTQCADPAPHDIDACLERARVLDETDPTPEAHALVAKLIRLQVQSSEAAHPAQDQSDAPPPADDKGVSSYDTTPPVPPPSSELGPLQPYEAPPADNAQQDEAPDAPADTGDSASQPDADGPPAPLAPAAPGTPAAPQQPDDGPHL